MQLASDGVQAVDAIHIPVQMEAGAECTHSDPQLVPAALGYQNGLSRWSSMGMTSSIWGCHHEGTGPGKPGMATQGSVPRC